jgi:hypothetical protein
VSLEPDFQQATLAELLNESLIDVVAELRGIEVVDLIEFIRLGSFPAIEDLLSSSTELFFNEGSMVFGWTAAVDLSWDEPPTVILGMEFRHSTVSVFFDLALQAERQAVRVAGFQFEAEDRAGSDQALCLAAALAEARLARRVPARPALRS